MTPLSSTDNQVTRIGIAQPIQSEFCMDGGSFDNLESEIAGCNVEISISLISLPVASHGLKPKWHLKCGLILEAGNKGPRQRVVEEVMLTDRAYYIR